MKTSFHRLLVALGLLLSLGSPAALRADTSTPMFGGSTLTIHGDTLQWQDPAIEDGTYHHDTYTASNGSAVTVTGLIASPNLATVAGSGIDGFLLGGTYGDLVQSGSTAVSLTFNGREYGSAAATTTFTVDLPNGQVTSSTTTTFSGAAGSFTAAANGDVSGSETGYMVNGTFYLNSTITSGASLTLPNGHEYTSYSYSTVYSKDGNGEVVATISETYSGGNGSFTIDASGAISGAESGFVAGGSWYVNGPVTSAINLTLPNGHVYTSSSHDAVYARDGNGQVVDTGSPGSVSGVHGTFTVDASGVISGSEGGYYLGGTWYVNGSSSETINWTSPTDKVYTSKNVTTTYALDGSGQVLATSSETYTNGTDSFTVANESISGSESGYVINGMWYMNENHFYPVVADVTFFGTPYHSTGYSNWTNYDSTGNSSGGTSRNYTNADGSWYGVSSETSFGVISTTEQGWDARVGNFANSSAGWTQFTTPFFAPSELLVDGVLFTFQSSAHDGNTVADSYASTQGAETLTISGIPYAFKVGRIKAAVIWNGAGGLINGDCHASGAFVMPLHEITPQLSGRSQPFLLANLSLWVNGLELPFLAGFDDAGGGHVDVYQNASSGDTLKIYGSAASAGVYDVVSGSTFFEGGYASGVFQTPGCVIALEAPPVIPPAFWSRGLVYLRDSTAAAGLASYSAIQGGPLVLTKVGGSYTLSGSDIVTPDDPATPENEQVSSAFSGTFTLGTGIQVITRADGVVFFACEMIQEGNDPLQLRGPATAPADGSPPGLTLDQRSWRYVGTITAAQPVHYFGSDTGTGGGVSPKLITLTASATPGIADINYRDHATMAAAVTGTFDLATHLIHTGRTGGLPMPAFPAAPADNFKVWEAREPDVPENPNEPPLPPTFRVGGDIWRFARMEGGNAIYEGYYAGQRITVQPAGTDGKRLAGLVDTDAGIDTQGTFNELRQSILMRNGLMVHVLSGDENGTHTATTVDQTRLHTIAADLDITGNLLSFGSLTGDASLAGSVFQFSDPGGIATLHNALSRAQAQWVWSHAASNATQTTLKVMQLDASHKLTLYDPSGNEQPGVVLDPAENGVSTIRGVLRVRPGGNIDMGSYTQSPEGMTAP